MPSAFLSYSRADKTSAHELAKMLTQEGVVVWLDERELNIGDSLIQKISEGIEQTEYVIAVISTKSVKSNWVQKELSLAMTKEIEKRKVVVLPILIETCELPDFLKDKVYADFTKPQNYEREFLKLLKAMGIQKPTILPSNTLEQKSIVTQKILQIKSKANYFEDIRLIGVDKARTRIPDPSKTLYNVYFELSAKPPTDWIEIFNAERSLTLHNMRREAWVEGRYIVVHCPLDEIQGYHLRDIKKNIENTNKRYREALGQYEAQRERELKRKEEEERRKNNILGSLNFD